MELPEKSDNQKVEQFTFVGNAGEYFGIWIVNHVFTWMTLGIYSAWAKVRTLQYFYGNTELAGGRFQFTASPLKILRGRIIAVLLFILYFVVENVQSTFANIVLFSLIGAFFIFSPVLTVLVLSFKLRYSKWRGINFRFEKNYCEAYRVYLVPMSILGLFLVSLALPFNSTEVEQYFGYDSPVYQSETGSYDYKQSGLETESNTSEGAVVEPNNASATGQDSDTALLPEPDSTYDEDDYADDEYEYGEEEEEEDSYLNPHLMIPSAIFGFLVLILIPYFDFINMRFLSRNARLGQARFHYIATPKDYYQVYAKWFLATLLLAGLWGIQLAYDSISDAGLWWVLIILTVLFIPATRSYFKSQRYNLLLSKTTIDKKHQLRANTSFFAMFWLMLSNSIVVILTLGMMKPWAQIRTARYLFEHSSIDVQGSLDEFIATQESELNASAEGVADVFDLNILG